MYNLPFSIKLYSKTCTDPKDVLPFGMLNPFAHEYSNFSNYYFIDYKV